MNKIRLILISLFLLIPQICFSACTGLPKTGQTVEYQAGDDGTYEKGWVGTQFTDNLDGTISDSATGLMWIKQPELIIPGASVRTDNQIQVAHGDWVTSHAYIIGDLVSSDGGDTAPFYVCIVAHTSGTFADDLTAGKWILTVWTLSAAGLTTPSYMTWANSIINCEALVYAGFSDWRLPNIKELPSIVDYSAYSPAIDGTFFPNTQSDYYWSGTTCALYTDFAWLVHFYDGYVDRVTETVEYYVRPVRGSTGGGGEAGGGGSTVGYGESN